MTSTATRAGDVVGPTAEATVRRPALLGEMAVVLLLVTVYDRIRDVAATRSDLAFADAARLMRVERLLHLDVERPLNLWLAAHWDLEWLASWYTS